MPRDVNNLRMQYGKAVKKDPLMGGVPYEQCLGMDPGKYTTGPSYGRAVLQKLADAGAVKKPFSGTNPAMKKAIDEWLISPAGQETARKEKQRIDAEMKKAQSTADKQAKKAGHTRQNLEDKAKQAGLSLFGDHPTSGLMFHPITEIEHVNLSELLEEEEDGNGAGMDDYEYIFFPSTGKGVDVKSQGWYAVDPSWVDSDGKIYSYWAEGSVRIVNVDVPLKKKRKK